MSLGRQLLVLLVLVGLAGAGWYLLGRDGRLPAATGPAAAPAVPVELAEVRTGTVETHVEAVGTLRARQSIRVVANASGRVAEILFEPGRRVAEGDVLVRLDRAIEQAALAEARATLENARSQYERGRQLAANRTVSEARLDELAAAYAEAQARVAAAEQRLREREIRAPFAGVVGLREVDLGARVTDETVITTLDDLSAVELDFSVPEVFFERIRRGQPVQATAAAFSGRVFEGKVTAIDTRIDPVARAFRVRAEFPNPDAALPPGLFMVARVTLETRPDALLVPEQAVILEGRSSYVFRVRDGVAERIEVRLGQRRVGEVEVLEGLAAGDRVVVGGLQRLRDGVPVRVADPPPATS